jgi:hypothetical protein
VVENRDIARSGLETVMPVRRTTPVAALQINRGTVHSTTQAGRTAEAHSVRTGRPDALAGWNGDDPGAAPLRPDRARCRGQRRIPGAAVLVFRDPDGIQLELFYDPS